MMSGGGGGGGPAPTLSNANAENKSEGKEGTGQWALWARGAYRRIWRNRPGPQVEEGENTGKGRLLLIKI